MASRKIAWCAWSIASLFYAYQYILRVMPNIMLTDIMHQFNIDATIFGQFSGAYYLGYCFMHLPIGIMLDRFSPRKVMSGCILLTVIGLLPIIYAHYWVYPILGRLLIGIGSSAAILGAFKIIRMTFNEAYFTKMLSFTVTIGLIGAIYGGMPLRYLCDNYGAHAVIKLLALVGIIFAAITYYLVPETDSAPKTTIFSNIKMVFAQRKVIAICFFAGLMVGPMEGFADAWGSEFLKTVYGLDTQHANYFTSMMYFGMCFAPFLSRIAEKTQAYIGTIAGAGFGMLIVFILLLAGFLNPASMSLAFFIVGLCSAYQILAIYKASIYLPEQVAGLTTAVANMIIMSFGYFFHSIIGLVVNAYTLTSGISVIPIGLGMGTLGFFLLAVQERTDLKKFPFKSEPFRREF